MPNDCSIGDNDKNFNNISLLVFINRNSDSAWFSKMKFLVILALIAGATAHTDYTGYTVFRMYPKTQEQKDFLQDVSERELYDVWADVNNIGQPVDVMVKPTQQFAFLNTLRKFGLNPEVYIENVQSLFENEKVDIARNVREMSWDRYYTLDGIYSWLDEVAASNPTRVSIIDGGSTYENRSIKGVKISFRPGRQSVFIEGGIHAREWISPATITYLINELLTSTDPSFRKVADSFDWYLFPVTNPDGFVFTHTNTRLWRKTRTPHGICFGADPNRNWNARWMEEGTSNNPCSDTYGGPSPFSEIETNSLANFITSVAPNMVAYFSFHSYAQLILLPYGHTTEPLDNYHEMMQIGTKGADALKVKYGTSYKVGNVAEAIYKATGSSIDWVKQEFQTPMVLCYELRDTGRYGFVLPSDQIKPNSEEVMDSIVAMFEEGEKFGYVTLS